MAILRVIGNQTFTEEEFVEKNYASHLALSPAQAKQHAGFAAPLGLAAAPVTTFTASDDETPLPPIGYGQPLTIDIRHVYTGATGDKKGKSDIAVVSGVAEWGDSKASARGLNWVAHRSGRNDDLDGPDAFGSGVTVVAYQKAVLSKQVRASFELAAAGQDDQLLPKLGDAFRAAAGIPLFLPYSGVLLAAGKLIPLVGKLIGALSQKTPWATIEPINFGLPGTVPSKAEIRIVVKNPSALAGFTLAGNRMVDAGGNPYAGPEPYMVIAIFGGADTKLETFTPAVMSADLMKRFYGAQGGAGAVFDDVIEIMKVASDVKFRNAAQDLKARVAAAPAGSDQAKLLQKELDATLANIIDPALKPS